MGDFDLDLRTVEEQIDETDDDGRVILDILDGSTPDDEWVTLVTDGNVLVLAVDGEVNELAAGFAEEVDEAGGNLATFREMLVVTPPGVDLDTSRL